MGWHIFISDYKVSGTEIVTCMEGEAVPGPLSGLFRAWIPDMMMRFRITLAAFLVVSAALSTAAFAHTVPATPREEYERLRIKLTGERGKRHLEIGQWCNDAGLLDLAKEQFQLAYDLSTGGYRAAGSKYLSLLGRLSPASIKKNYHNPTRKELKLYVKKRDRAVVLDRKGRLRLADFAFANKSVLMNEALTGYRKLVEESSEILEFDRKGRIVLDAGTIPEAVSRTFRDSDLAITVNLRFCLRAGFLKKVPEVREVFKEESERLRVFSVNSQEEAASALRLGDALLPVLQKDFKKTPDKVLTLFLFQRRGAYEHFCDTQGHSVNKAVDGFSSLRDLAAVISMEDREGEPVTALHLQCMVLHELVHLCHFALSGSVMPGWYDEGLAETYGGRGTFEWDGKKLKKIKGLMSSHRLVALRNSPHLMKIEVLIATEAQNLLAGEREGVLSFYAQSWAFLRFLRSHAGARAARLLAEWEDECRSSPIAADAARVLFRVKFGSEMAKLEKKFANYLKDPR